MFTKFKIFNWRIMVYARRVYKTGGINSKLASGLHIPMFDCDKVNIRDLETEVIRIQELFRLGRALIVNTGRPDSYHVYYLTKTDWRQCIIIGANFRYVDLKHIQFSLKRGHFTLRLLPKATRTLFVTSIIESMYESNVTKDEINSFVLYETANK